MIRKIFPGEPQHDPKVISPILKTAIDWLNDRRHAIENEFRTRLFASPADAKELINELVEIDSALEGEE